MDERILYIVSVIQSDVARALDLRKLAQSVNLSQSRLQHVFKAETGMSIGQCQREARIGTARLLLETTFLSIKEVMNAVGISDGSNFAHEFKKTHGLTPTGYRSVVGKH